jgi:ERF superfamily
LIDEGTMSENKTVAVKPNGVVVRTGTEVLESIEQMIEPITRIASNPTVERKKESEDLRELYKALAVAQKNFSAIQKSGLITGRNIPYAKIDDLMEASRAALRSQNLVANTVIRMDHGIEMLVTRLYHYPSGQYMESELPLLNTNDEQKRGSSITYAWRYTVAPLIGLVDNSYDDDGESTRGISVKR